MKRVDDPREGHLPDPTAYWRQQFSHLYSRSELRAMARMAEESDDEDVRRRAALSESSMRACEVSGKKLDAAQRKVIEECGKEASEDEVRLACRAAGLRGISTQRYLRIRKEVFGKTE